MIRRRHGPWHAGAAVSYLGVLRRVSGAGCSSCCRRRVARSWPADWLAGCRHQLDRCRQPAPHNTALTLLRPDATISTQQGRSCSLAAFFVLTICMSSPFIACFNSTQGHHDNDQILAEAQSLPLARTAGVFCTCERAHHRKYCIKSWWSSFQTPPRLHFGLLIGIVLTTGGDCSPSCLHLTF